MKFSCLRCGTCCKGEQDTEIFGIRLFDFEAKNISEKAKEKNLTLRLKPSFAIADKKTHKEYGVFYQFETKDCPFFSESGCKIYDDRPIMCRAFPIITSGANGTIVRSSACKGNQIMLSNKKDAETVQDVIDDYGSCYQFCALLEALLLKVKKEIKALADKKIIIAEKVKGNHSVAYISDYFNIYGRSGKEILGEMNSIKEGRG